MVTEALHASSSHIQAGMVLGVTKLRELPSGTFVFVEPFQYTACLRNQQKMAGPRGNLYNQQSLSAHCS